AAARPAVHDQHRLAVGIAALLVEDLMTPADLEPLLAIGLDRGIEAQPLACRHRLALPFIDCFRRPAIAGRPQWLHASRRRWQVAEAVMSAGGAVPEAQQPHLAVVERLSAG